MKKTALLFIIMSSLVVSSCTTMVRIATTTHKSIMDSYKTKEQVIGRFGIPTSKRTDGIYEEFYYLFGTQTVTDKNASLSAMFGSNKTKNATVNASNVGYSAGVNGSSSTNNSGSGNANAAARTISQEVKTYVKFTFKGDNVVTWTSEGVDYGIYEMVDKRNLALYPQK